MKKVISSFVMPALLVFGLVSCSSSNLKNKTNVQGSGFNENLSLDHICPSNLQWQPVMDGKEAVDGFEIISYEIEDLNVSWTCVKADLNTPGIEIIASPGIKEWGKSPKLQHVNKVAKKNNAVVAVNATPWQEHIDDVNKKTGISASGIVKINGKEYFPPIERYSALAFTKEPLRARILQNQLASEIENYDYAFGGFFQVLKNSELINFNKIRRSRCCVGTNSDGSQLYFFVVASKIPTDRNGFTFEECGMVLKELGCTDVMHFDGGHSSCLVVNGKDFEKPLLNRKIPIAIGLKK